MKVFWFVLVFLTTIGGYSQITGTVTDQDGNPLSAVNVFKKESYRGTTTNAEGHYRLEFENKGTHGIVFKYLGYKTKHLEVDIDSFPYNLNVKLVEQPDVLTEVVVQSGKNPADHIIKKAIEHRRENLSQIKAYTADFYSKGRWSFDSVPKRVLGRKISNQELKDRGLDSTGNGILYLSETRSRLKYRAPDDFHEHILASKVSGDDNGFSLNSAKDADFSFYHNTIKLEFQLVSPIADYAFSYYTYKLISARYDDRGHLINKIKVIPKNPKDRVFSGIIYIVDDYWQIYGAALKTSGNSAGIPPFKTLNFNQTYTYSAEQDAWIKMSQDINFNFKLMGFSGHGQFIAVYSNYDFSPNFSSDSFGAEIMNYDKNANQKDSLFWNEKRPIPLTAEETADYRKKDSLQKAHKAPEYLDSVDREANKFKASDVLLGYSHQNSTNHTEFKINSPLFGTHFNTVQGWNTVLNLSYTKRDKPHHTFWEIYSSMNYGFADHRYRASAGLSTKLNNFSKPYISIEGGAKTKQINNTDPIPLRINDIANIFFERNYLKLYEKQYIQARYSEELFNGFRLYAGLAYMRRHALINHTDQVIGHDRHGGYTSNNPLAPADFGSTPFQSHHIGKFYAAFRMRFGQHYYSYPDGKYIDDDTRYPTLLLSYHKGFASTINGYNYDQFELTVKQDLDLKNYGQLSYKGSAGGFLHEDDMALIDYKHFDGNQLRVAAQKNYVGKFNLLPYYKLSSNKHYSEAHAEQNFKGFVLGKIPYLNRLNFNLVIGAHGLWTADRKPYQEYSIGLDNLGVGNFRFFRVDYVQSIYSGSHKGGVIFGLQFLNFF